MPPMAASGEQAPHDPLSPRQHRLVRRFLGRALPRMRSAKKALSMAISERHVQRRRLRRRAAAHVDAPSMQNGIGNEGLRLPHPLLTATAVFSGSCACASAFVSCVRQNRGVELCRRAGRKKFISPYGCHTHRKRIRRNICLNELLFQRAYA